MVFLSLIDFLTSFLPDREPILQGELREHEGLRQAVDK
jgi:hypothetical protein